MKEFRVAKCLVNGLISEYAIFADGSRKKLIRNDKRYGKYFEVDNELNNDCIPCLRFSYNGRIKDAIDMIRNGNGDCLDQEKTFRGVNNHVLYFLDRKIGDDLRKETIENWKNIKFGWTIKTRNKHALLGGYLLNKKAEPITMFMINEDNRPMTFETKEDAKAYAEELVEKAKRYAKRLAESNHDEIDNAVDIVVNDINKEMGSSLSIIEEFMHDMLDGDYKPKSPNYDLDLYSYEIIQCVVRD